MRIVIVTDANNATAAALVRESVRICNARPDVELAGFVTSRPQAFHSSHARDVVRRVRRLAVAIANPGARTGVFGRTRFDLFRLAHAQGVPVLSPAAGGLNDPEFVAELRERTRADVALSYYCRTIWKTELLRAFAQAVNYHDGLLPEYKGVAATSFSIYNGEATSGFTFHHMTEGIDAGPILVQGSVTVDERSTLADVDRRKAHVAVAALPDVFDLVAASSPGRAQDRPGSYCSGKDLTALSLVARPDLLSADELLRRIRAFGRIGLEFDGAVWPVTRMRSGRPGRPDRGFTVATADGRSLRADRIRGLPVRFARRTVAGRGPVR